MSLHEAVISLQDQVNNIYDRLDILEKEIGIKVDQLDNLKKEYFDWCKKQKASLTYRGLLGWLKERAYEICYSEGIEKGLLDFNNLVYRVVEFGDKNE